MMTRGWGWVLLGLLLGLAVPGRAQQAAYGPLVFPGVETFYGIGQGEDGRLYVAATNSATREEDRDFDLLMAGADRGRLQAYRLQPFLHWQHVAAMPGGCVMLGVIDDGSTVLVRLDTAGRRVWARKLLYTGAFNDTYLTANPDGELLLSSRQGLVRLRPDGSLRWALRSLAGTGRLAKISTATLCGNGDVAFGNMQAGALLYGRIAQDGNRLWQAQTKVEDAEANLYAGGVAELATGELAFAIRNLGSGQEYGYVLRAGSRGRVNRLTRYKGQGLGLSLLYIRALPGGGAQVSGQDFSVAGAQGMVVATLDSADRPRQALRVHPAGPGPLYYDYANHLRDAAGNVHLLGRFDKPGTRPAGYWTRLPPDLAPLGCDATAKTLQTETVAPFDHTAADDLWLERYGQIVENIDVTATQVPLCAPVGCAGTLALPPLPGRTVQVCGTDAIAVRLDAGLYPGRYAWSTGDTTGAITATAAGRYTVDIQTGCGLLRDTFTVEALAAATPTVLAAEGPLPRCQGETVTLTASGLEPLVWNDGYVGSRRTLGASGSYWVQGTGQGSCRVLPSDTITLALNPLPPVDAGPAQALCEGDALRLPAGTEPGIAYTWQPVAPSLAVFTDSNPQQPQRTIYTQAATNTATGCAARDTASVLVHSRYELAPGGLPYCPAPALLVPTLISPDGDGRNDAFEIKLLPFYQESTLEVYSRHGRLVYSQSPYDNRWAAGGLPAGTYFYRLRLPGPGWALKGWVEVVR